MSDVIKDGLQHFRCKLAFHNRMALRCESEVARLEALQAVATTGAVDGAKDGPECSCPNPSYPLGNCVNCGLPPRI